MKLRYPYENFLLYTLLAILAWVISFIGYEFKWMPYDRFEILTMYFSALLTARVAFWIMWYRRTKKREAGWR